jgi:histidinol-phosphate aminotransferase
MLTKRSDIEWLVANKPKGSILLLDEAYIHFSGADFASDLEARFPTFQYRRWPA